MSWNLLGGSSSHTHLRHIIIKLSLSALSEHIFTPSNVNDTSKTYCSLTELHYVKHCFTQYITFLFQNNYPLQPKECLLAQVCLHCHFYFLTLLNTFSCKNNNLCKLQSPREDALRATSAPRLRLTS